MNAQPDFIKVGKVFEAMLELDPEERIAVMFWFCGKCGERSNECECVVDEE